MILYSHGNLLLILCERMKLRCAVVMGNKEVGRAVNVGHGAHVVCYVCVGGGMLHG